MEVRGQFSFPFFFSFFGGVGSVSDPFSVIAALGLGCLCNREGQDYITF